LLKAIDKDGMKESTETVELLLELGADPNRLSSKVDSQVATYLPLCYAAKKGYAAIVELLLKKDADIHAPDSSGDTVLLCAARYGRNQLVELLLNEPYRANIEEQTAGATDRKGYTPLMMAVHSGRIETVKLLLDKEAKGEVVDDAGTPLLHIAIAKGGLEVTRLLVEKGGVQMATVDARFVNTALHCAIRSGSIEVGKYLIDKAPALIHAQNYKRETPLSLAARKKTLGLIEPLVKKGARMDAKDELGRTPLHVAVLAKDMEMVRTLVRVGAKLETPDSSGRTPLHSAVMEKDVASVKTLFELGSKTDCSDNRGRTPLHEAVIGEDLESVKTLLTLRCNMVVKDRAGKYPLQYVLEMPKSKEASALELLREFLRAHERNTPFHDKFHALIKATRDGRLAFVHEIRTNDPGLVTWRPHADSAFQLPLHEAIKADKKEVLEELCMAVKGSSAIDTKDHRGNTALHQSILSNQHKMIRLLIGNGANKELISGEADGSLPPLHLAAREMNLKAVEVLLSMGAKAKRRISGGEICDKCKEMKTRPEGRNARCILRNLDPSVRSNHNFKLIDKALITAIKA
jgi:ankyrin repeat protein